jgi:hypothetical protein
MHKSCHFLFTLPSNLSSQVARTAVTLVLQDSAESQLDCDDTRAVLVKADALKNQAILEATRQANELIANTKDVCNDQKQCLQPVKEEVTRLQ